MSQEVTVRTSDPREGEAGRGGLLGLLDRLRGGRSRRREPRLGRTIGVVWERPGDGPYDHVACTVQIERKDGLAIVTIFDGNDPLGQSVMNAIEEIACGIYLEHLAREFSPSQVQFFHRDTKPFGSEPHWGLMPVAMTWNAARGCFENPSWGQWRPDFEVPELDRIFVRELRARAAVAAEEFMRKRHEEGRTTPREEELYRAFQEHISAKSEIYRYNLRGGWLYAGHAGPIARP